jgi:hypothetical protein
VEEEEEEDQPVEEGENKNVILMFKITR